MQFKGEKEFLVRFPCESPEQLGADALLQCPLRQQTLRTIGEINGTSFHRIPPSGRPPLGPAHVEIMGRESAEARGRGFLNWKKLQGS
jgi:hypothetical protein